MTPHLRLLWIGTALCGLFGCSESPAALSPDAPARNLDFGPGFPASVAAAMEQAKSLEIVSLWPWQSGEVGQQNQPPMYHGYEVMGSTTLTDPEAVVDLQYLVARAVRIKAHLVGACFQPRHGIRVDDDGSTVEWLLCFQCFHGRVYRDGELVHSTLLAPGYGSMVSSLYQAAGLPIAPREPLARRPTAKK